MNLKSVLPTQDNLKLWNQSTSDKRLCVVTEIACYTHSQVAKWHLEQGRSTWRHDNIIKYIADSVDTVKYSVYANIEGYINTTGGTLDLGRYHLPLPMGEGVSRG